MYRKDKEVAEKKIVVCWYAAHTKVTRNVFDEMYEIQVVFWFRRYD